MNKLTRILSRIVIVLIFFLFLFCAVCLIFIPKIVQYLSWYFEHYIPTVIAFYIGILSAIWLLFEFFLIMLKIHMGNPFVSGVVRSLRHISISCAIAASAIILLSFYKQSLTLIICAGILLFGMLCALVLSIVFSQAILYKQDSDLTI